jgi:predicted anti-sigma-YlaC factor YlaD
MNHQPFENWIFTDGPLQPEDQEKLNEHLQSCESCRRLSLAMEGVRQTFISAPSPAPAPGFTHRWQERLAVHRHARQQRRMWILTLAMFGLASVISLAILLLELGHFNWFYEFSQLIAHFSRVAAQINQIWVVFQSIHKTLPIITPIMIVFGVGSVSAVIALIVTWFSSMVQLYQPAK